jgi:hypothetical protein
VRQRKKAVEDEIDALRNLTSDNARELDQYMVFFKLQTLRTEAVFLENKKVELEYYGKKVLEIRKFYTRAQSIYLRIVFIFR